MRYTNRNEAGTLLASALEKYRGQDVVVLAVPRGGLPVGAVVAKSLEAPLDVALSKKIGHPNNPEYAIGAISLTDVVLTDAKGISEAYIQQQVQKIRQKLHTRYETYHKGRPAVSLSGKVVVIVDDGVATGNTITALTKLVSRQQPEKIVVAVPVAPPSAIAKLRQEPHVDEVVCLQSPEDFQAVGQYYLHFYQVSDEEAIRLLNESRAEPMP